MRQISTKKGLAVILSAAFILVGGALIYSNRENSNIAPRPIQVAISKRTNPASPQPPAANTETPQEKIKCFEKTPDGYPGGPISSFSIQKDPQYCWELSYPKAWSYEKVNGALDQFSSPDGNVVAVIWANYGGQGAEGSCAETTETTILGYSVRQMILWDSGEDIINTNKSEQEIEAICSRVKRTIKEFTVVYTFEANEIQNHKNFDGTFSTVPIEYSIRFDFKNTLIANYQSITTSFLKGFRFVGN